MFCWLLWSHIAVTEEPPPPKTPEKHATTYLRRVGIADQELLGRPMPTKMCELTRLLQSHYDIVTLLHCSIVTLLHCYIVALLHYYIVSSYIV